MEQAQADYVKKVAEGTVKHQTAIAEKKLSAIIGSIVHHKTIPLWMMAVGITQGIGQNVYVQNPITIAPGSGSS